MTDDKVERVAIALYHDLYKDEMSLDRAASILTCDDAKGEHHGDCTKEPMTCLRCEREHMLSQARAAIAAAEPPGWKLVPVEPTLGMLRALTKYLGTGSDEFAAKWALGSFSKDYAAMLDAAPPPGADK